MVYVRNAINFRRQEDLEINEFFLSMVRGKAGKM